MNIYIDLLIISNFLLDYSILTYTGHITKEDINIKRILLGTIIAVSSLVLLYISNDIIFITLRVVYSLVIVFVAFEFLGIKKFIVNLSIFYVLNFLLAGILLSFNYNSRYISVDFLNARIWILLLISFILANILTYILKVSLINSNYYKLVKFNLLGRDYQCHGYLDTGNDTMTNKSIPIIFINDLFIKEVINEDILKEHDIKYEYITCQTINNKSKVLIFKPSYFKIKLNNKYLDVDVYLSVFDGSEQNLSNYKVILNKKLLF